MVVVLLTGEQCPVLVARKNDDKAIRVGHRDVVVNAGVVGGVPKQCVCLVWRDDGPRTGIKTSVVVDENVDVGEDRKVIPSMVGCGQSSCPKASGGSCLVVVAYLAFCGAADCAFKSVRCAGDQLIVGFVVASRIDTDCSSPPLK